MEAADSALCSKTDLGIEMQEGGAIADDNLAQAHRDIAFPAVAARAVEDDGEGIASLARWNGQLAPARRASFFDHSTSTVGNTAMRDWLRSLCLSFKYCQRVRLCSVQTGRI